MVPLRLAVVWLSTAQALYIVVRTLSSLHLRAVKVNATCREAHRVSPQSACDQENAMRE